MVDWNAENIELVTRRWAEGASARVIAQELGDSSMRSAVIGKVHRLGLAGRDRATAIKHWVSAKRIKPRSVNPFGRKGAAGVVQAAMLKREQPSIEQDKICNLPPDKSDCAIPFMKATSAHCRWPLSEPTHDMMICGAKPVEGRPYCSKHCSIAYEKPKPRKAKKTWFEMRGRA